MLTAAPHDTESPKPARPDAGPLDPVSRTGQSSGFDVVRSDHRVTDAKRVALMEAPGFGRVHTDHMVTIRWTRAGGWERGLVGAYRPLELDPMAMVLHYGQAIFEGLKAYRQPGGGIALFRPEANAARFAASARRLAMPALPPEAFLGAVQALIDIDAAWVPAQVGQSLYLRPFMIATEAMLGVRPADEYLFMLIASPVDRYFPGELRPVSVWISDDYVRAAPGGTGEAKCAGNYAASLLAQAEAAGNDCEQVVWLDSQTRTQVEEMGGMNVVFVRHEQGRPTLVTPPLTGTILPGITRAALLELAGDLGYGAVERPVSVAEWKAGCADGSISEVFACGTAAVLAPIGRVRSAGGDWTVGDGTPGPVTSALRERLLAVQHGLSPDDRGWMHQVG